MSLRAFRGKVVLLAFNDSECTTICPLTTTAMLDAKAMLGAAGANVQLLGVDANPKATSLEDVLSYSELHGMLHAWHFLTGSLGQLKRVWGAYKVEAAIQGGEIAHTPALFVIDPRGPAREALRDPAVLRRDRAARSAPGPGGIAACCPATRRCARASPTRRSPASARAAP